MSVILEAIEIAVILKYRKEGDETLQDPKNLPVLGTQKLPLEPTNYG